MTLYIKELLLYAYHSHINVKNIIAFSVVYTRVGFHASEFQIYNYIHTYLYS